MSHNPNQRGPARNNPQRNPRGKGRNTRRQEDPDTHGQGRDNGYQHKNKGARQETNASTKVSTDVQEPVSTLNIAASEFKPMCQMNLTSEEPQMNVETLPESPPGREVSLAEAAKVLPEVDAEDHPPQGGYDGWTDAPISATSSKLQDNRYKSTGNTAAAAARKPEKSIAKTPMPDDLEENENLMKRATSYEIFDKKWRSRAFNDMQFKIVDEIQGNLFEMDKSYALANCVASDLNMGAGIAVTFRQDFKGIGELLSQNPHTGGLVFLHHNNERYIYYLVTKKESTKKPTYETLYKSLEKLHEHMVENDVKLLAIPRLGCGLDRLEWDQVKAMIEYIFMDTNVKITVCNYQQADEQMRQKKIDLRSRKCKTYRLTKKIMYVEKFSIVLYIGSVDGGVDENLSSLFNRFSNAQRDYKNSARRMGDNIVTVIENYAYYVVGCIAKQSIKDHHVDYVHFEKCISAVKKENEKFRKSDEQYGRVAIQEYASPVDDLYMEKLKNLLETYFYGVDIHLYLQ